MLEEVTMARIVKLVRLLTVLSALVGGGMALWRRRDKVKQAWDSVGGAEGIKSSASKLRESVGPLMDLASQMSQSRK